jgi:hypothetical protein
LFLLSMNEVKLDLVISKQIFFIDFLEELVLYIEEKTIFTNKKKSVALPSAVISWLSI